MRKIETLTDGFAVASAIAEVSSPAVLPYSGGKSKSEFRGGDGGILVKKKGMTGADMTESLKGLIRCDDKRKEEGGNKQMHFGIGIVVEEVTMSG